MAYRADLETRRAAVRRLEEELDALREELALLRSAPTSRRLEARILGAPTTVTRQRILDEQREPARHDAAVAALRKIYDDLGRVERTESGIVWRSQPEVLRRDVEVRIEELETGRTMVRVSDVYPRTRAFSFRSLAWLGFLVPWIVSIPLDPSRWWELLTLAVIVLLGTGQLMSARAENQRSWHRRARQALAAERALAAALGDAEQLDPDVEGAIVLDAPSSRTGPARSERAAFGNDIVVVERSAAVAVEESDHERLAETLRSGLGWGEGTTIGFGRVMGWTHGDSRVEVHAQVAPSARGSAIRLVQRPGSTRTTRRVEIAMVLVASVAALVLFAGTGSIAWQLGAPLAALFVALMAASVVATERRGRRKLEVTADALVRELESASRGPRIRVEDDDADADALDLASNAEPKSARGAV